ncbi:MAG: aldehyde dehydrogenase family protein, partial [Rhodospirillales bacterium]|nr:aldehyde dehydrogenase family protein [Rhodospirillales bacterium]
RCFELMSARLEDFARLITLENGKARADAMGEAAYAAEFFRWFSEEAVRAEGHLGHAPASGARILVHQKPAGVAVLVTPWNFPAAMATRKIGPALAAGCTCRPPPRTRSACPSSPNRAANSMPSWSTRSRR